jgi:hypothetical protein
VKFFEPVVVVCEPAFFDHAHSIRSVLEAMHLRVHFIQCIQRPDLLRVLGGDMPESEYVVFVLGGYVAPEPESLHVRRLVECVDGQWEEVELWLTPDAAREHVHLPGRTVVVAGGCSAGMGALPQAFLDAGCRAYIAPGGALDGDAAILFTVGFFYQLLQEGRHPCVPCSEVEAVTRAAAMDTFATEGTHVYRRFAT